MNSGDDQRAVMMVTTFERTNEATATGAGWYGDMPVGAAIRCDERYNRCIYNLVAGAAA